ncbi:ATP-binding protein [Streptomyces tsukubensis]|uniref:Regulator n=1 Tax=Streptomyces tsukubensis TaxID=83656 RepID=A0A1V4A9U8_9ACTN|nr:ATP-binding protein [Streptomyces tsukubensis]OON80544.1 regulator [Streptomyces tsukubensis]QFR96194.1 regulator [Streptomyces tsukubensis]
MCPVVGNLPVPATGFVGRNSELAAVERALAGHRLVTLTGGSGVGKSRLALRRAALDADAARYPDGVWWADLSHLYDDRLLMALVCDAVGLLDHAPRRPVGALCEWLAGRRLLLVLDCCDRVAAGCGPLVRELLDSAPGLTVLATGRKPLAVEGEYRMEVPPLPYEAGDGDGDEASEAVRLFRDRCALAAPDPSPATPSASAATHDVSADPPEADAADAGVPEDGSPDAGSPDADAPDTAAAVADICRRLEGNPLAIELACARVADSGVAQLAERLTSPPAPRLTPCLDILTDASAWPKRHRALRTAIGWSHELCTPLERLVWARLSVFRGAIDEMDAVAVCAGGPLSAARVPALLEQLAEQSVILREGGRYRMFGTVREYGAMWLAQLGEDRALALVHADHFARQAALGYAGWLGRRQIAWYRRIADSHADLCAALDLLLVEDPARAVEMAGHTGLFWTCGHLLIEARDYLERALTASASPGPHRTRALWALGATLTLQGAHEVALRVGEECEAAARGDRDPESLLAAAHTRSFTYLMMGNPEQAHAVVDRALRALSRAPLDAPAQMCCRVIRIFALSALGRLDEAYEEATGLQELSVGYGEHWARAYADHQLALIHLLRGRPREAESHARSMLASKHELRDSFGIALGLDLLAGTVTARGDGVEAARISGTGHTYWRMLGHPHRGTPELGAIRDQWESQARVSAGHSAYDEAYRRALQAGAEVGLAHALGGDTP